MDNIMQNWVTINAPYGTDFTIQPNKMRELPKYRKDRLDFFSSNFKHAKGMKSEKLSEKLMAVEPVSLLKPTKELAEVISNSNKDKEINYTKSQEIKAKGPDTDEKKEFNSKKKLPDEMKQIIQKEEIITEKIPSDCLSLDAMVNLKLHTQPVPQIRLPEIYRELTIFDPNLTGFTDESQFTLLAMKYEMPLKVSTIRLLCRNFADKNRPHLVNYFKLLKFLASCLPLPDKPSDLLENKPSITSQELKAIMDMYPVSDKIVSMLKDQLSGSMYWDLQKFYEALLLADRYNDKHLPAETVLNVCMSQRVPLTSSLLIRLLQISEIEVGVVDWQAFISPILHACAETTTSQISWQLSEKELNECLKDSSTSVEKISTSKVMKRDLKWNRNFSLLMLALKNHNPYETDLVPRSTIERMLSNYNIVYELGYTKNVMDNAIDRAVVEEKSTGYKTTQLVSVEKLLKILSSY